MNMKNLPHPGEIIRDLCIEPLHLMVTLSLLLNEHVGISPEMADRLSKAFGRSPESWFALQALYDLAQVYQQVDSINVKAFVEQGVNP